MECSKCKTVKDKLCFYATGKVCKDCKRNYSRTYRSSRTAETRSCATTDDASVRSVDDDYLQATEDAIVERMRKIEADIAELKTTMCDEMANLHHTFSSILERMCRIEDALERFSKTRHYSRSIHSHPLSDLA
jgi:hypothetical protein